MNDYISHDRQAHNISNIYHEPTVKFREKLAVMFAVDTTTTGTTLSASAAGRIATVLIKIYSHKLSTGATGLLHLY
jgi:hypothetical protein